MRSKADKPGLGQAMLPGLGTIRPLASGDDAFGKERRLDSPVRFEHLTRLDNSALQVQPEIVPAQVETQGVRRYSPNVATTGGVSNPGATRLRSDLTRDFVPGPMGEYYYPVNEPLEFPTSLARLRDAGSRSAVEAGLACATPRTDHAPDEGTVDIGFHYQVPGRVVAHCQDVLVRKGEAATFSLIASGNEVCQERLTFQAVPGSGPAHGQLVGLPQQALNGVQVTYIPEEGCEGRDSFRFVVRDCGVDSPQTDVFLNVVPGPLLVSACRQNCINLRWSVPLWVEQANLISDFRIYRCETTGDPCVPTDVYATASSDARSYTDTEVEADKTYCYRLTFRHRNGCNPPSTPDWFESPFSNTECRRLCTPPQVLISGNTYYSSPRSPVPIVTYDFASGNLVASFVPDGSSGNVVPNGRGLAIHAAEVFYTELGGQDGSGPSDGIHVAPYNQGRGGGDLRTLGHPRPGTGIRAVAFHGGLLYALTGYSDSAPQVFRLHPQTGQNIGGAISISGARTPENDCDGAAVLPSGNFLINDGHAKPIYREYLGTTGAYVPPPGGLEIDLTEFGFSAGTGVAVAPDGQSLYFVAGEWIPAWPRDILYLHALLQVDLAGQLLSFQEVGLVRIEDIDVVAP